MSTGVVLLVVLVVVVLGLVALWAAGTASRLDRLHVRTDTAWVALDAALARRAVVARALARDPRGTPALARLADRAERADRRSREDAENALSAALDELGLDGLDPRLAAELADAEARVLLARRFHNDAVRDTLALRGRRPVRLLRLGGTAPAPTYLEIAERRTLDAVARTQAHVPADPARRDTARVVVLDEDERVLVQRGRDPRDPSRAWWTTVGGGVEEGEDGPAAAVRELWEETGLRADAADLVGPVFRRTTDFAFDGVAWSLDERYWVLRVPAFDAVAAAPTELERRVVTETRWCSAAELRALAAAGEPVYPPALADLLGEAADAAAGGAPVTVRDIT
ncbi:NUDIX domain-containing protein [Rhodococcus aerolatus]